MTDRPSRRDQVFDLLSDLQWHRYTELSAVGGICYHARVLELKRMGYPVETRGTPIEGKDYRMMSLLHGEPQPKRVKVYLREEDAAALIRGDLTNGALLDIKRAYFSFENNKSKL